MLHHQDWARRFSLLVVISLIFTACIQPDAAQRQAATIKGVTAKDPTTFVSTALGDPATIDPALDYEFLGYQVIRNTYNTLIYFNKSDSNSFVPELALMTPSLENGGIAADGKTYTFQIRKGVKFHSGDTLTPADVAFTFQRGLLQGGGASPQWLLAEPLLGVTDVAQLVDASGKLADDQAGLAAADAAKLKAVCAQVMAAVVADAAAGTVTFRLQKPWAPFLATLAQPWGSVTQQAWISANGGWDGNCATWQKYYGKSSEEINKTKIGASENGTGPYILDHWTPGAEYVLKANPNYWRTELAWPGGPSGAPALKTIVVKLVPEFSKRLAMLQAGDADSIIVDSAEDYPQMDALVGEVCDAAGQCQPSANADKPLRVYKGLPNVGHSDIFLNQAVDRAAGKNYIGSGQLDGNGIPPDFFSNLHIRKAFAYCFDWATFIKQVQQGEAVQVYNVMLPGMVGYEEHSPHYTYNPAQCRAEFAAAAPELAQKYGAKLDQVGFRFTIAHPTGADQWQKVAEMLKQSVAAINPKFVIELTDMPWPDFLKNQQANAFPLFINGWTEDIHDPHNWVVPYSVGFFGINQGLPAALAAQFKDITKRGVAETDPAKRAAIYHEFNQLFYDQAPTILLSVQLGRRYEQRWVKGWFYNAVVGGDYYYGLAKK